MKSDLFYYEDSSSDFFNDKFKFFYFRTSPRGNCKFGVTDIPWQRLRVQQQGTDEVIKFDHLWLIKTSAIHNVELIEEKLKSKYKTKCLATYNHRAGHTEWFSNIDPEEFETEFLQLCELKKVKVQKVPVEDGYFATNRKQCPFNCPATYDYT
jgi:hypothetical protein